MPAHHRGEAPIRRPPGARGAVAPAPSAAASPMTARKDAALPVLRSEDLFRDTREVTILHAGAAYRLRLTANDKLILTK